MYQYITLCHFANPPTYKFTPTLTDTRLLFKKTLYPNLDPAGFYHYLLLGNLSLRLASLTIFRAAHAKI
jgi:hypothetical protein